MCSKPKKYQHLIPKFVLRLFLNTKSYQLYDVKSRTFITKGASNSMGKDHFYEHADYETNEIEDLLAERENKYAPLLKKIMTGETISEDEYRLLVEFRHVSYYRSNEFLDFHNFRKNRGDDSWIQRQDWRMINGVYSPQTKADIQKTQLKAIQNVINGTDEAFLLSLMTPLCFLYRTRGLKFILSDTGSIGLGDDQFNGVVVIVISPSFALGFPRTTTAIGAIKELGLTSSRNHIIKSDAPDELVEIVNNASIQRSYEFYIDPNQTS